MEALRGYVRPQHRFLLELHLRQVDGLDQAITAVDRQVEAELTPFRAAIALITTIPGLKETSARGVVAEIGIDMSRFPDAGHLVSWSGLCSRNDESAGKRRSNRLRPGNRWLKTVLVQCAWAASRAKNTYLQAQFHRLRARRGAKKALVAVAASILTAIYHMLRNGTYDQDLGPEHFHRTSPERLTRQLVRRLTNLGYHVELKPAA